MQNLADYKYIGRGNATFCIAATNTTFILGQDDPSEEPQAKRIKTDDTVAGTSADNDLRKETKTNDIDTKTSADIELAKGCTLCWIAAFTSRKLRTLTV